MHVCVCLGIFSAFRYSVPFPLLFFFLLGQLRDKGMRIILRFGEFIDATLGGWFFFIFYFLFFISFQLDFSFIFFVLFIRSCCQILSFFVSSTFFFTSCPILTFPPPHTHMEPIFTLQHPLFELYPHKPARFFPSSILLFRFP